MRFKWTAKRNQAAVLLANGHTNVETAAQVGVACRTVERWRAEDEFSAEVDRLSLMTDIASRAERLRMARRMVRKIGDHTEKDLLDWLKYIQSETDGVRLDLAALAEVHGEMSTPTCPFPTRSEQPQQ